METETVTLLVDSVILIDHFSGTGAVRDTLAAGGWKRCGRRPDAFAERFIRTIKESCLERLLLMGKARYVARFASSGTTTTTNGIIKA